MKSQTSDYWCEPTIAALSIGDGELWEAAVQPNGELNGKKLSFCEISSQFDRVIISRS